MSIEIIDIYPLLAKVYRYVTSPINHAFVYCVGQHLHIFLESIGRSRVEETAQRPTLWAVRGRGCDSPRLHHSQSA